MKEVVDYYSGFDEWGRLEREPLEFQTYWHYLRRFLPPSGHILDNGAGPGRYALKLAERGYEVTVNDLTPRLVQQARGKAEERGLLGQFRGFHSFNATHLSGLEDQKFDASLMLGPLYHLQREEERNQAASELYRVTKSGGYVFVAMMTRTRHLMTSLLYPQHWQPNDSIDGIKTFLETGVFNHRDQGRFTGAYYFKLEEIESFMQTHGFQCVKLVGSSGTAGLFQKEHLEYWRKQGDGDYAEAVKLMVEMAGDLGVLGLSPHVMCIGRRI
ncbi:class I SAM-dependent methyltransferase [Paenibacillus harenae]|uniref:Ubiquinone/menaquinone biosynthesis C-methylase UbiE n=1 Tax=Paenibacillus harenae TaxID=306543 RepID=A0ABT9UAH8_PAEHA|nr:class I SAM-dependent methyltransferase [Paenibacillus harenae]MDQ0115720.1 ubiquinone/menaquinone biosynthesis C-methylase UbiE [Paenibacillus harenae]